MNSSYRYARHAGRFTLLALLMVVGLCFQMANAGLDEGTFDLSQPASVDPLAWAWSPNSTSDGDGVEFIAYLSAFQHAGPSAPSVTTTVDFKQGVASHQDVADFAAWIVANNAHVTSTAQLTIVKRVVTTVTLP